MSDLSATALRDTVERVQKTLGDCDNHADLVCSSGDHHVDVDDVRELLAAVARLQEERDGALASRTPAWHLKGVEGAPDGWTTHAGTAAGAGERATPIRTPEHLAEIVGNIVRAKTEAELAQLRAEVSRLTTALQQAGKDGERLDWLQANPSDFNVGIPVWTMGDRESGRLYFEGPDLREAIDDARASDGGTA